MKEQIKDFYRELDLESGTDLACVRQSYLQLVKVWHPDRFAHDQKLQNLATDKLKRINSAYDSLVSILDSDPNQRTPSKSTSDPQENPAKTPATLKIYREGIRRYNKKDYKGAAKCFLDAAEMGDANAQYAYGFVRYMKNVGHYGLLNANKHFSIILRWWTKAAEQGHINAQFMVGVFHQLGFSTPYDESEARKWFERAASKGHIQAQQWLKKGILRKLHAIPLIKWVMEAPPSAPPPSYD
jgi:hypothetical protein